MVARFTPIDDDALTAYNSSRDFSTKQVYSLCYAPYTTLYFDTRGSVRVCCHNAGFPVGNVAEHSIEEIWQGFRIKALRESLTRNEFATGCEFCRFQTAEGCFGDAAMRRFDNFPVAGNTPAWPQQLEFSISNVCNLECVMCSGLHSSAIRKRREKLPALPRPYSDSFINSLQDFLSHAKWLKFLGGEPFLVQEYYRIWDIMVANNIAVPCHVTTNGTQYSRRVEQVLARIPMSFAVSMDGVTRETVESIRVNACYRELIENAWRFREYARHNRTSFSLTYCLMRNNWHEFGRFCLMADIWECAVSVNTVNYPAEFGLYTLAVDDLRSVLDEMETESVIIAPILQRNRKVWLGELERIRRKVLRQEGQLYTDSGQ